MTLPLPFTANLPLYAPPFKSRIQTQMDSGTNYFMVAFKPGYPLQAAELNELQEIFYVQQTLTQQLFANWHNTAYLSQGGTPMTTTPWTGCTPVNPALVVKTVSDGKISVVLNAGWYLLQNSSLNGGFNVWVYATSPATVITNYDGSSPSSMDGDYGMIVETAVVNCTTTNPAGTNEDRDLQDASNISVINGPCGAARIQTKVIGFGKSGSQTGSQTFLPILTALKVGGSAFIKFKNNYTL